MIHTIYIAPGNVQCRVYLLPYPLRQGQRPLDILPKYRDQWKEIGLMNWELKLVCLEPAYSPFRQDIEERHGGCYFEIDSSLCSLAAASLT
jgi:hypothetical protein